MKITLTLNKIVILAWIALVTLISCKTEQKKGKNIPNDIRKTETIDTEKSALDSPLNVRDFSEQFGGVWLPKKYLNGIEKSRSAYLSKELIPQIAALTIHKKNLKNDTLFVGSSLNNHEGYGFDIYDNDPQDAYTFSNNIFNWDEENKYLFAYDPVDTTISIIIENRKGKIENRIDYNKVLGPEFVSTHGGFGYQYISRKTLMNGKYQILDALGNDFGVASFNPETGQIQHFKFSYYAITTDFTGPHYPGDYILLRHEPNKYSGQEYLTIINRNDTILLYDTEEILTDSTFDIGLKNIRYYLVNKNYEAQP